MEMKNALEKATLLPKGHGRLKDVDEIIRDGISKGFCEWYDEMKYAPTIIEADVSTGILERELYEDSESEHEME